MIGSRKRFTTSQKLNFKILPLPDDAENFGPLDFLGGAAFPSTTKTIHRCQKYQQTSELR